MAAISSPVPASLAPGTCSRIDKQHRPASNGLEPPDPPSPAWLGLHSLRPRDRQSRLWNLDWVREQYTLSFIELHAPSRNT
jgi:hypothetical protein